MRGSAWRAICIYLGVFGLLWALVLGVCAIRGLLLHHPYPHDTILFDPHARFSDYTIFYPRFEVYGMGDSFFSLPGFPFTYPAPLLIACLALRTFRHPLAAYLLALGIFALTGAVVTARELWRSKEVRSVAAPAAIVSALSFPLLFLLDRANLEGVVWIAGAMGVFLLARHRYSLAAVAIGLAASMKLYPCILLLLFLRKRRYKDFFVGVGAAVAFEAISLWAAGPTFLRAAQGIASGMNYLKRAQALEYRAAEIGFDHSMFGMVKQVAHLFIRDVARLNAALPRMCLIYTVAVAALFALLYITRIRTMPWLNQLLALAGLSVALPFVSYDYTLVHLFAPFGVFMVFIARDVAPGKVRCSLRELLAFLLPFAVIFTPQSYLVWHTVGMGGQLKAMALVALVWAAVTIPLPMTLFAEVTVEPLRVISISGLRRVS